MSFIHLHVHSQYSLLDGLSKIDELISLAKDYGMPGFALTDHGVMYGVVEFYQKMKKAGLKPIIGVEAYVAKNKLSDKRPRIDERPYHLILLAKNYEGYQNLMKMTTMAHLDGYYYKPRIDHDVLRAHSKGIIGTSACLASEVARALQSGHYDEAAKIALFYQEIFGKGNFYLEVQHHPNIPDQITHNESIYKLSRELDIPIIATNDSHYPKKEDAFAQDVLMCIAMKKTLDEKDRMSYMHEDFSFRSPQEMKGFFADHLDAIENTLEISEKCNIDIEFGKIQLPHFEVPKGKTDVECLRDLCTQGLSERYSKENITEQIQERLEYELSIIEKTGYAPYFLIVADFINWAKDNGIVVGPGRGSAAGSIVSYLTKITDIDPIQYDLLFERFLNPERISMPDIDTDFADTRRDEVLRYVSEKYGENHVGQIITFGTMAARAAIRDVGRVMGLPYTYCDKAAKMIPMFMTLQDALNAVPELKEIESEPQGKKLLDTARRVEGCVRHASTHACGVVITPDEIDKYAPRQKGTNGDESIMTQYGMHAIEDLGLLKMDFLGLKNLTIIENTLEILKKARGIEISLETLPLADKKTYRLLQRAETTGVFQLESSGMKRYLKQLKPNEIEDIIAMVSLYRPGPMELIPDYISGKHGKRNISYIDPKLEPILKKTYGIAVYQEQIMQIARDLAGFTYGEADVLRKAVGKKIASLLDEQEEKMISGMIKNNIPKKVAKAIWEFVLPFARYGFNRSHAACYAMIAYRTAFLKANFPVEFMASLMTADQDNTDRIAIEISECREMGIEVLPPDINESYSTFTAVYDTVEVRKDKQSKKIRFGLNAVKNLGGNIVKEIIRERKENGPFQNLEDLLSRITDKDLNKKSLEALIKSGGLDSFDERNKMLHNIDKILTFIKLRNAEAESKQSSLFGLLAETNMLPKLNFDDAPPANEKQKLAWEKELLGLYLSSHPLDEVIQYIKNEAIPLGEVIVNHSYYNNKMLNVAGVITQVKKIHTRKGDLMMFVRLEDQTSGVEVLIFPKILQRNPEMWREDAILFVYCRVSDKDGETKLLCEKAWEINKDNVNLVLLEVPKNSNSLHRNSSNGIGNRSITTDGKVIELFMPQTLDPKTIEQTKDVLRRFPGPYRVQILVKDRNANKKIATNFSVSDSVELKEKVESIFGTGSFQVKQKIE